MIYSVRNPAGGFNLFSDGRQATGRPRSAAARRGLLTIGDAVVRVPEDARPLGHYPAPAGRIATLGQLGDEPPAAAAPAAAPAAGQGGFWDSPALVAGSVFLGAYAYYRLLTAAAKGLWP